MVTQVEEKARAAPELVEDANIDVGTQQELAVVGEAEEAAPYSNWRELFPQYAGDPAVERVMENKGRLVTISNLVQLTGHSESKLHRFNKAGLVRPDELVQGRYAAWDKLRVLGVLSVLREPDPRAAMREYRGLEPKQRGRPRQSQEVGAGKGEND